MTITVDVEDVAMRLSEMLAEVAAGREVILARGAEPLAKVTKAELESDIDRAVAEIRAVRRRLPRTTIEEILEWKDEDRR